MLRFGICVCLLAGLIGADGNDSICSISKDKSATPACMGAIVGAKGENEAYIVTSARCVYRVQPSSLTVTTKEVHPVDRVIVHPFYYPPNDNYDVALLRIKLKPPKIMNLEKTKLPSNATLKLFPKEEAANIVEPKQCQEALGNSVRLSGKMLCASASSENVLLGSPLVHTIEDNSSLVGVAFYNGKEKLKVFTKIANSEIYSFIEEYIN